MPSWAASQRAASRKLRAPDNPIQLRSYSNDIQLTFTAIGSWKWHHFPFACQYANHARYAVHSHDHVPVLHMLIPTPCPYLMLLKCMHARSSSSSSLSSPPTTELSPRHLARHGCSCRTGGCGQSHWGIRHCDTVRYILLFHILVGNG